MNCDLSEATSANHSKSSLGSAGRFEVGAGSGESRGAHAASATVAASTSTQVAVRRKVGVLTVRPDLLAETFLQDCSAGIQAEALHQLAMQSLQVIGEPVSAAAWHNVPSTYVVCADDRGTPVERQRTFALRAGSVVELETGHHPFLSRPDLVRDVVLSL